MYILQIADFHIDPGSNIELYKNKVKKLLPILQAMVPQKSEILCCLLGDFSDKGNTDSFCVANDVLVELQKGLAEIWKESKIEYEIVPGNHDLCEQTKWFKKGRSLSAFNEFASKLLGRTINYNSDVGVITSEHFGYRFYALNTVLVNETSYGAIDFEALEETTPEYGSVVISHHGLVSSDPTDVSAIRNGYRLHQFLEDRKCAAFLHGHVHGYKRYTVGNGCQVVGVGPMFKNEGQYDISNQCNVVKITGGLVREVKTLIYQGDRDTWDVNQVYEKAEDNNYVDSDVYALYCRVLRDAKENKLLPNLRIQIQTSFSDYESSITEKFDLCKEDAIAWQSVETKENMDFTHGQQMNTKDTTWQQFVIDALKKNPTSKRAIIPLIDKEKAFRAVDDRYLVSLDIIQVGFSSDTCKTLYITVYMRALEVRHFLPINLYETYLIAKTIRESFPSIEELNVCIFAFRAEAKEHYSCFKKAQIDVLSESRLCKLLVDKKYATIVELLQEKSKMGDTVIDTSWIVRLKNATNECLEAEIKDKLLEQMERVFEKLNSLKKRREHCSDYSITQEDENAYCTELVGLINLFGRIYD